MASDSITISDEYWNTIKINKKDIDFINNYLFDKEAPQSAQELTPIIIEERIRSETDRILKEHAGKGKIYSPAMKFSEDENLVFPVLDWEEGKITHLRPGFNPELGDFEVITVKMKSGGTRQFASSFQNHPLDRHPATEQHDKPGSVSSSAYEQYGPIIEKKLVDALQADESLVKIAGKWFPRSLLINISMGHLNLAEAILDEANGKPLTTQVILKQLDLPEKVNANLLEFSMNYALQEDKRFDEIGPAGEVLWCLEREEPAGVRSQPVQLKYTPPLSELIPLTDQMKELEIELDDELSEIPVAKQPAQEVTICLSYPHWRAGTLPISSKITPFIPYAYESERIRFKFSNKKENEEFPAWVVRKNKYVYGLSDFYAKNGLIPGSLLVISHSDNKGVVNIEARHRRPSKEWIRTVLVGRDGGIVFAMLKQNIAADYNERMVIAVPDIEGVDQAREQFARNKKPFEESIRMIMEDLTKLNLQGHIHAQELYSAVNVFMRCPPAPLFSVLSNEKLFKHVGDLHYRLEDAVEKV